MMAQYGRRGLHAMREASALGRALRTANLHYKQRE